MRKLTTHGEQTVHLKRSYGYCPICQVGFFPAFMSNWDCAPSVAFTPRLQESMVRLGTWMPFRRASRELAFFTEVQVSEATVRTLTEVAGATQVRVQTEQGAALLQERPASPVGPASSW